MNNFTLFSTSYSILYFFLKFLEGNFQSFQKERIIKRNMRNSSFSNDFRVIAKLGEGSFAEVFKVKSSQNSNALFAVKRLKKRFHSHEEVNHLPEVTSLQALQGHPNIIKLFDVLFDSTNGYVALVFELMDYNLYEYVKVQGRPCDERQSLLFIYQLLKSIAFMHSKNLFHRDIKPENCMVNKQTLELKLVDFGSTRSFGETQPYTEYVSTRWYRAPECILTSGSYGKEVDVWAAGCMLYELLTTRPLFPGKHELDQIARIHQIVGSPPREMLSQFRKNPNTQISLSFPARQPQDFSKLLPNVSSKTIDLICRLLTYDFRTRITADEALEHPAFEQLAAIDRKWQSSGEIVPFPVFYNAQIAQAISSSPYAAVSYINNSNPNGNLIHHNQHSKNNNSYGNTHSNSKLNNNPYSNLSNIAPNMNPNINGYKMEVDGFLKGNKIDNILAQEQNHMNPVIQPKYPQHHNNNFLYGKQKINHHSNISGLSNSNSNSNSNAIGIGGVGGLSVKQPQVGYSLKEYRMKAAQRIREYNQKKYGAAAAKMPNGAKIVKKVILQPGPMKPVKQPKQGEQQIVYQKPGPEILMPRPPKLNHF
ncbi:protein kinase [Tritrichomonas foetus]|uniref:Protein kinase n=1 Tax=Tritrichomonas foetus TaxID=1144522 RepID=A0A1J4KVP6_9EUKA|nr:protein kinase [Tritrichomonas foetus]|eukprot:OHT13820.1 protein kinase [Tritrichomonas foetus]